MPCFNSKVTKKYIVNKHNAALSLFKLGGCHDAFMLLERCKNAQYTINLVYFSPLVDKPLDKISPNTIYKGCVTNLSYDSGCVIDLPFINLAQFFKNFLTQHLFILMQMQNISKVSTWQISSKKAQILIKNIIDKQFAPPSFCKLFKKADTFLGQYYLLHNALTWATEQIKNSGIYFTEADSNLYPYKY